MNHRVVPFFDEHEIALSRVLTGRGTEFGGKLGSYEYELYLAVENVNHTCTKAWSLQKTAFASVPRRRCSTSFTVLRSASGITARLPSCSGLRVLQPSLV